MWSKAQKVLSTDKYIGPLIKKYGPCKIAIRHHDTYFVDLVDVITSQQLSIKAAATIFKRVKDCVPEVTPDTILKTKDQKLRDCGLSWAKIKYVKDLAQRTKDGSLKTKILDKLPDAEVRAELVAVKGIGKWTADMFLMFTLARPDILPVEDLGIRNGMTKLLKSELSKDELEKFALRWAPFRTVASWYIWQSLDSGVEAII